METFDSTKSSLIDLLRDIESGKIQLPDFQRGWVWDDDHVRSLLVSIARSFPVGAVMLMETGGEVRFQVRPIEGLEQKLQHTEPERLILDGQQRLTSLTQAVALTTPVNTRTAKGKPIQRHYYFDIHTALEGEEYLEQAIVAVDENRQIRTNFGRDIELDLSSRQLECEQLYFPCDQILNSDDWEEALQEFAPDAFKTYMQFRKQVISAFRAYQLPIIELKKETSKEAVCLVFEKVNTGGVSLSVFELITASYAAEGFNLRDDWFGSDIRGVGARKERIAAEPLLEGVSSTDFLQAVTLHYTKRRKQADIDAGKTGKQVRPVSVKRSAVLELPKAAYLEWADKVEQGFRHAAQFLRQQCFFNAKDLPYSTQLIPLAAVMTVLGNRWREPRIHDKLSQWFWCGVLGELYGGAVETRVANDFEELQTWFQQDDATPRTIIDATFDPDRLDYLKTRLSAAYKGVNVLVLRNGAKDFFWKGTVQELEQQDIPLDIHHIFPKAWCQSQKIPPKVYDSIINKTPISYKANRKIGGAAPSQYLQSIQGDPQVQSDDAVMDSIVESHQIDAKTLRLDDFDAFWFSRKQNLVELIDLAMGKKTSKDHDWLSQSGKPFHQIAQQVIAHRLPAPLVGLDLVNSQGVVIGEGELVWPEAKCAFVDDTFDGDVPGWLVIKCNEGLQRFGEVAERLEGMA